MMNRVGMNNVDMKRTVAKIGGSIIQQAGAPERLRRWLAHQECSAQLNLIVGGGNLIDALRELDRIHQLNAIAMHWRCVRALRATLEIVAEWLPNVQLVLTRDEFERHRERPATGVYLIAIDSFYTQDDADELPQSWATTSDSIAALLAKKMDIEHLQLLKSLPVPGDFTIAQATEQRWVDEAFELASRGLQVEWVTID